MFEIVMGIDDFLIQLVKYCIQSIKICFHLFFNFFRIFCAQHQIRFLIVCNSFQPALYMVTEILEIIYLLFLSNLSQQGVYQNFLLRNDMNIISSISVTDIVLMIIWGNEIIELFPK